MARKFIGSLVSLLCFSLALGCGGKAGDVPAANVPAAGEGAATTGVAGNATAQLPDSIVTQFLDSLRAGNREVAEGLLTKMARQETAKSGFRVEPPGTPGMSYAIGQTEYVTEAKDGAHVGSIWTEKLPSGEMNSFAVIWVLRLEPEGWRIAGLATPTEDSQPPIFFNFEDAADLEQKYQDAEAQVAGEGNPPAEVAPGTAAPLQNAKGPPDQNPLR